MSAAPGRERHQQAAAPAGRGVTGISQHPPRQGSPRPLSGLAPKTNSCLPRLLNTTQWGSPFCLLPVPPHPPGPGTASQPPPVSFQAPVLPEVKWSKVLLQPPPSCLDSWLPSEVRQYREMFAPKQPRCFRNCLALPRKANSGSPTPLPPQSAPGGEAGAVAQQGGHQSTRGLRPPQCGDRGALGSPRSPAGALSLMWVTQKPDCQHLSGERGSGLIWPKDNEN